MYTRILTVAVLIFYSNLVPADQTDDRLETLFITLSSSSDKQVIRATENQIWDIWFAHPNSDVERLMQIGVQKAGTSSLVGFLNKIDNVVKMKKGTELIACSCTHAHMHTCTHAHMHTHMHTTLCVAFGGVPFRASLL